MMNRKVGLAAALGFPLALALVMSCSASRTDGVTEDDEIQPPIPGSGKIPGCIGACAVQRNCPAGTEPTTLTGTVTIPSGTLPLYNAKVYIPLGETLPPPPMSGATCDRCDQVTQAIASTTTDIEGRFKLTNVPSGQNIPLIIRVGKWRRVVIIPNISDCTTTALDAAQTHLPRNKSEGNIPKIALTTGKLDSMECLLRKNKLGLDDSEFTLPTESGRVNYYFGDGGSSGYAPGFNGNPSAVSFPLANPWWDELGNLRRYDILILSCEGSQNMDQKSTTARQALLDYINMGGRVFASHWHNGWLQHGPPPLSTVATFGNSLELMTITATINTTFEKGKALADWMMLPSVKGSTTPGQFTINNAKNTTTALSQMLTQRWVYHQQPDQQVQYFSFNAPIGAAAAQQCGQMVFTDMHFGSGRAGEPFPEGCTGTSLSPQEKALLFMLFDLTNCLQPPIG